VRLDWKSRKWFGRTAKAVLSLLLVLQLLFLLAMVACPALHHAIHHDSDSSEHHCAATIFAQGQVEASVVEVAVTAPAAAVQFIPQTLVSVFNPLVDTSPPGRGPPVSLLSS
jgi:hypothetical protein